MLCRLRSGVGRPTTWWSWASSPGWSRTGKSMVSWIGFTTGGAALTNLSSSYDSSTHKARFFADPSSWSVATFTFRYAVVYKSTGVAGTSPLVGYVDFGGDESATSATVTITWDASAGVLNIG